MFLMKKIAACSKFAVALTINTIRYRMQYLVGKDYIYLHFSIFLFKNFDTDFQLSWTILKVKIKSRTFQI